MKSETRNKFKISNPNVQNCNPRCATVFRRHSSRFEFLFLDI